MRVVALFLALMLAACAKPTPYQPAVDRSGGYGETLIEPGRWRVTFTGNSVTPREEVETGISIAQRRSPGGRAAAGFSSSGMKPKRTGVMSPPVSRLIRHFTGDITGGDMAMAVLAAMMRRRSNAIGRLRKSS